MARPDQRLQVIEKQVPAYAEMIGLIDYFGFWTILPFDNTAAQQFTDWRKQRVRTWTMDMKIASIAVTRNCLLLTANTRDFARIPNLRIEDWAS